jgi:hypothetical protein
VIVRALLALLLASLGVTATPAARAPAATGDLDAARAEQVQVARRYRESLATLLPLHEAAVARAAADAERRRELLARDLIARTDLDAAERALGQARVTAERTRTAIVEADGLVAEAEAAREVAARPPPARGQTQESPGLIRYEGGPGRSSLAAVPALARFFADRFGYPLPISALGQTALHDRLGFDHRNAVDLAVHPDSVEGRALMEHLRARDIPFLAFRAARAGVATGAHVHVGEPSARRSSGSRITGRVTRVPGRPEEAR